MNPQRNYYRVLMCRPSDGLEQIKSAYRQIAKRTHTDANQGSDEFRELFEAASEAWRVLGDPAKREAYETARSNWLLQMNAIQCAGCGEALRLSRVPKPQRCPICKSPLTTEAQSATGPVFYQPLIESGRRIGDTVLDASEQEAERLGRELVQQSAVLLSQVIVKGFERARRRFGRKRGD